jgi:adenylate cyclase
VKHVLTKPTVSDQVVAFADLRGYHRNICSKLNPEETFGFLSEYYAAAHSALDETKGRIVKFIGDAILLVFPAASPHEAVEALRKLKTAIDAFLSEAGYDSRLCIRIHVGTVAAGMIGRGELERFDVFGIAVNETALLPNGEWVLSDELQKRIGQRTA